MDPPKPPDFELTDEIVDKVNDLLGTDLNRLAPEHVNELITKLKSKINNLKDNFICNLPHQYSDEAEFFKLCEQIAELKERLAELKEEHAKAKELMSQFNRDDVLETTESNNEESQSNWHELRTQVIKRIGAKRKASYVKCLMRVEVLNESLENCFLEFESIKAKKTAAALQESKTSPKKPSAVSQAAIAAKNMLQSVSFEFDNSIDKITKVYKELVEFSKKFASTKCTQLRAYILKVVMYWNERIKQILVDETENHLKNLSYPLSTNDRSSPTSEQSVQAKDKLVVAADKAKAQETFKLSAMRLLDIEFSVFDFVSQPSSGQINYNENISIVNLLVQPLEKRFKFHFFTNRKTNNLEKPEWYLSQILQWVKDHDQFISTFIQPIFDNNEHLRNESALIKFSNRLIGLVREKVEFDLPNLLKNQVQFSHTIDELLLFDSQLKTYLPDFKLHVRGNKLYTCLHFICQSQTFFSHWLSLERQVCQKKLDVIFSYLTPVSSGGGAGAGGSSGDADKSISAILHNETAGQNADKLNEIWSCNYADVDAMKPPQCAESFVLMLKAMRDRFGYLPYPSKKLRFVNLQIELIKDFHLRLCQIVRDEVKNPFSKSYMGALNTINYVIHILDEWKNSRFYIKLQFFKIKYEQFVKKNPHVGSEAETQPVEDLQELSLSTSIDFDEQLCSLFDENIMITGERRKSTSGPLDSLFEIEGTLFDEVLPSYEKVKDEMVVEISSKCKWEVTSRSKFYKKEKWMAMPLFSEFYKPTLTQTAADMLISLKNLLYLLKDSMAKTVFESIIKKLTVDLDKFFFGEIIMQNQFNEGGVLQLDFDVKKYLVPILNEFAYEIGIENYFRMTKEALILLKLKQGSAILLKEIVMKAFCSDTNFENSTKIATYNAKNALKEFGIVQLNIEQARDILHLRTDFIE